MKILLILLITTLCRLPSPGQGKPVIVELFTSQGCSSCPSADVNLTEILQVAKKEGKPVYGLSFHVDYWNYIGWKDPYSRKVFTERQRAYGEIMAMGSIYTPQMIINGKIELVGSDKSKSAKAIEGALEQKPVFQITIEKLEIADGVIKIRYSLDKEPNGEMINMAVVETEIENHVSRREQRQNPSPR